MPLVAVIHDRKEGRRLLQTCARQRWRGCRAPPPTPSAGRMRPRRRPRASRHPPTVPPRRERPVRGSSARRTCAFIGATLSRGVFEYGFVHADLHPGNIMLEEDGTMTFLDLGLVAEIPRDLRARAQGRARASGARSRRAASRVAGTRRRRLPVPVSSAGGRQHERERTMPEPVGGFHHSSSAACSRQLCWGASRHRALRRPRRASSAISPATCPTR